MSYRKIVVEQKGLTRHVTLNRPEKRNSLDEEMIAELTAVMKQSSEDKSTGTVLLKGAGGNFCSGLFLDYLHKISQFDILENKADSSRFKDMLLSIYRCRKPVIAMVDGYALAGGCGIASACDYIIASDKSQFGYTEVKIGFIPAIVMIFLLKRVSEKDAKELLLTSKFISGEEAVKIGFANAVVPAEELDSRAEEVCESLNKLPQSSIALTKEMFSGISSMSFESALEYAVDMNAITRMTEECRNGVSNFLKKSSK